jgi:PAS domain S-box-containing protein
MNRPLRVLIIEDSEDDALLLLRELRGGGYDPAFERVETPESMRSALREKQWDMIISDHVLPNFSGLAALAITQESGLDLPFIIVSGNIGEDIAVGAMRAGAHDYILKGNLKRLVPAVERELREAEVRHKRRLAEDKIRQASAYNRSLIEASLDPLVTIDADGKITDANAAAEKITGHSRENLIGTDFSGYFTEGDKARAGYQQVFREGKAQDYPLEILHRNGRTTPVLYNASVYRNDIGEVVGVFAAARDITAIREAESRILTSNEILRLFARFLSRKEYLDSVVDLLQKWCTCRCVGLRVADGEGTIHYESFTGFSHEFWGKENLLTAEDQCICTRVINENPDPHESPLITPHGSFHSGDVSGFFEGLPGELKERYRGTCMRSKFRSFAVIPIRYRDAMLGAVHMADEEAGILPLGVIEFVESVSYLIGEALHRFSIEDELHRNYEALQRSEKSLSEAQRIASLGNWDWDLRRNELHWSDEVYNIFGLDPHQFEKTYVAFLNYVHPDDRESVKKAINDALHEGKPYSIEHRVVLEEGILKVVHEQGEVTYADGEPIRMVGTVQDITERKIQEEKLRNSREQLRNLSAHLDTVREQERTSIAREIHDELGQSLTALKMDISWLRNKYIEHEPLTEKANSMIKIIDSTIRSVKRISSELRPVVLDDLGLIAAIEWQAEEFQKRTGIECRVKFEPDDIILDRAISTAVFRIFQEALTNVIRHAAATEVKVSLEETGGQIHLSVEDNGKGISEKQISHPKSFGLIGIRERVHFLGGEVRLHGTRNKGTSLIVIIPIEKPAGGDGKSL